MKRRHEERKRLEREPRKDGPGPAVTGGESMTSSFTTFILFHFLSSSLIITASRRVSSPSAPYGAEPRRYAVMSMKRRE